MNTEDFIKQQCRNAPHLRPDIAEFMLNAGVTTVLDEYSAAVPGWECDLHGWLVVGDNNETFVVETNHGSAYRMPVSEALQQLTRHQQNYNHGIALLTTELQQKAHVIA